MEQARLTNHVGRLRAENPVSVADHAIDLLQKRIEEEFGLRVVMGAELEFAVLPKPGMAKDPLLSLPTAGTSPTYDYLPSVSRKPQQQAAWFPLSGWVNRMYEEAGTKSLWKQLEVVFSHAPVEGTGEPKSGSLSEFADAIRRMQHGLQQLPDPFSPAPDDMPPFIKQLLSRAIEEVRLTSTIPGCMAQNGLHLNMSLVGVKGEEPFLKQATRDHFSNGLGEMMEENLYLLGSDHPTIDRLRCKYGNPSTSYFNQVKSKTTAEAQYLENGVPSASSNPSYAILLELAGIYYTLKFRSPREQEPEIHPQHMDMLTPSSLYRDFKEGTLLRQTLNTVEPQLGERFRQAIEHTPPGREIERLGRY